MARLYTFNCLSCDTITTERVEFIKPANAKAVSSGRFVIDLNAPEPEHNGYPPKSILCPKCSLPVLGFPEPQGKDVPPVFFNYMGDD